MAIKIFISSVFHELKEERKSLQEEINKLQDLFVGMEFFGSDPNTPVAYCIQKVIESDLYVGILGFNYGSVETNSKKSFTELEYDAALDTKIPCLIYFKSFDEESVLDNSDQQLKAWKERLRLKHIVYQFKTTHDLKLQFLVDFIKLLRNDLFDKAIPQNQGTIPFEVLHALTKGIFQEQIKAIAQDKYISSIYVRRKAEEAVTEFVDFDSIFRQQTHQILNKLDHIKNKFNLTKEHINLKDTIQTILASGNHQSWIEVFERLKTIFYVSQTENLIKKLNAIINDVVLTKSRKLIDEFYHEMEQTHFIDASLLPTLNKDVFGLIEKDSIDGSLRLSSHYKEMLSIFPSFVIQRTKDQYSSVELAGELIIELNNLIFYYFKRCCVIVDKAGSGKTNLLCYVAEKIIADNPVILLSGQLELSTEYDIEFHIQHQLELEFRGIFSDWMNRLTPDFTAKNKWLYIVVDGVNENSKLPLLIRLFKRFLPKLENKRIKLLISCRDLFWDLFQSTFESYIFKNVITLSEFSEAEWIEATKIYFLKFNIKCLLGKKAEAALRNPLLLRFFSEANKGLTLGRVDNLKMLSIFDLYLKRINENICQRFGLVDTSIVRNLLSDLSYKMWLSKTTSLISANINTIPVPTFESISIYNLILSENIILEENINPYSSQKLIRFIYDEFMEYMIALSWVDQIYKSQNIPAETNNLIRNAVETLEIFSPSFGAILYLDQMLHHNGRLINQAIILMFKSGKSSAQLQLVQAFENMNFDNIEDELIEVVKKFESEVRDDLKDRFAAVILKVFEKKPQHLSEEKYIGKLLNVDAGFSGKSLLKTIINKDGEKTHLLPPARFHYTEETKLSAISILVRLNADSDMIEAGIKKLGRTDLHSALTALEYLDLGKDYLVYKAIAEYISLPTSEYKIFSAWLLRERYGLEPAKYLVQLLLDPNKRVYQFAVDLFQERLIEEELINLLLKKIESKNNLRHWHLNNCIKILGKKSQLQNQQMSKQLSNNIVGCLLKLTNHEKPSIRLITYRSLFQYSENINTVEIIRRMLDDSDIFIISEAKKFQSQSLKSE